MKTKSRHLLKMKVKERGKLLKQWGFSGDSEVKNLPAMQETRVQRLGREDPLEKGMATHSNTIPGEFHGQKNLVGYSTRGRRVEHHWATDTFTFPLIRNKIDDEMFQKENYRLQWEQIIYKNNTSRDVGRTELERGTYSWRLKINSLA